MRNGGRLVRRWAADDSLFFFFSSRRRHTRFDCDWSSDVCSSDLFCAIDISSETLYLTPLFALGVTFHSQVDRKSTRLNSSHSQISYAVFCLKKKNIMTRANLMGAYLVGAPSSEIARAHVSAPVTV